MKLVTFRRSPVMRLRAASGFTLLEAMLVVAIALMIGAFTIVNAVSAARSFRLSEAAADYANLMQKARISAVKDDKFYSVLTDTSSTPAKAFVNVNNPTSYALGDPMISFPGDVKPQASGPNLSNLEARFLPTGASGTLNTTNGPTFSPRGLPCTPTTGTYSTCTSLTTPTSYATFLQDNQSQKWIAVTVNPAGRIRRWSYDGSSWNPLD